MRACVRECVRAARAKINLVNKIPAHYTNFLFTQFRTDVRENDTRNAERFSVLNIIIVSLNNNFSLTFAINVIRGMSDAIRIMGDAVFIIYIYHITYRYI